MIQSENHQSKVLGLAPSSTVLRQGRVQSPQGAAEGPQTQPWDLEGTVTVSALRRVAPHGLK